MTSTSNDQNMAATQAVKNAKVISLYEQALQQYVTRGQV